MSTTKIYDQSNFIKKLFHLVMPVAFQQFMLALVSASDAFMLGMLTQDALSAASLAGQVTFIENMVLAAMTIGLSMFAAQYWGKGDMVALEKIFAYVMKVTAAISFGFFLAALLIPKALMHILTNDPVLIAGGAVYLRVVSPSYLLTGISQVYLCILKNSNHAKTVSRISFVSVITNIILNAILIFGLLGFPKLGIAGAAVATVIARLIEVVWSVLVTRLPDHVPLRISYMRIMDDHQKRQRRSFWHYTWPVLANELVWGGGFAMFSVIMGHLGSDAVAANSIATVVKNLVTCFCMGLAIGGSIIVGNELGAGNLDLAKIYGNKLTKLAAISGVISGLVILLLRPLVLSVTTLTPQAEEYLGWMLIICSYYMVGKSLNCSTISGIFTAGGDSRFGLYNDLVVMWFIIVPLGMLSAFVWKLPVIVVYFILNLDEMIKLIPMFIHYRKYKWVKDLTKEEALDI